MQTNLCRPRAAVVAVALALLGLCLPADAHQGGDDKAFEKNVEAGLVAVINHGANLFNNQNDFAGCYRLYEGALMSLRPMLGKYPDLQKMIDKGLQEANGIPKMHDRAHALRKVIDEVRFTLNPELRPVAKTLWDKLGGEAGVTKVLGELMVAAAKDPKVNFDRNGKYPLDKDKAAQLLKSLVEFVSSATGGPYKYTGPSMKDVHKGMGITDAEFNALAGHLKRILEKNGVKAEDVKAVLAAVESTRQDIVEPKVPVEKGSLWNRLGGEVTVTKVVDEFIKTASADPDVNFDRGGKFKPDAAGLAMLKKKLVVFISHLTGGPYKYEGKDLKEAHKGMGITDKEFNASTAHLQRALEKYGAKAADIKTILTALAATRGEIVEKSEPAPDPNMAVLTGQVMIKGQPLTYGFVTFVDPDGKRFSANIQKDGKYVFKKGFPPGAYKVLIEDTPTPPEKGEVRIPIPAAFQTVETTPLTYTATKGKAEHNINLQ
jgi:truncated hemoglobin YjbI